jgi:hypothetical protein
VGLVQRQSQGLTVHQLPPYSPKLNATKRLWHHTRVAGTHNQSLGKRPRDARFESPDRYATQNGNLDIIVAMWIVKHAALILLHALMLFLVLALWNPDAPQFIYVAF